jgi:hypothetical protein
MKMLMNQSRHSERSVQVSLFPQKQRRGFLLTIWFLAMVTLVPPVDAVPVQLLSARNPSVPLAGGWR